MRVRFSKIHCPSSICFSSCKPPQQLCNTPPPSAPAPFDHFSAEKEKKETVAVVVDGTELVLKSRIKRKVVDPHGQEVRKKTVQWMVFAGKSLAHVKEFELSDSDDTDSESKHNKGCICAII